MSPDSATQDPVIEWLLEGDVSIRWQVMRDLLGLSPSEWEPVQRRVATEGWGARILDHQDSAGRWTPRFYGKKWISTTYSMALLRRMGLPSDDPRPVKACRLFIEEGLWHDGGVNPSASLKRSETCVTGMVLALLSWFRLDIPERERLVDYLLNERMADGGWNCQRFSGATHSSFNTTINVLEGLREYVEADASRAGT